MSIEIPDQLPVAHLYRYLWRERDLLVIVGDLSELYRGHARYGAHHGIAPAPEEETDQLHRLLAAAGLASALVTERNSWGWSVTLPGSPRGLFCGVEPEGMVCGHMAPAEPDKAMVVLQRQRADEPMRQSHFVPPSADPLDTVQDYFDTVEQTATRVVLGTDGYGVLVQAMPDGRFDDLDDLDDDTFLARVRETIQGDDVDLLGEFLLFYECRCHDALILDMLLSLPETQRDEMFGDLDVLEVECPRCGRIYRIDQRLIGAKPV